jgi:hypothetical protein
MAQSVYTSIFDDFADDLLSERSCRPLIIVGTAKIDLLLHEILRIHLLPKLAKAKESDELLEGDRPLATLSARIKLCYRLGLIDGSLYGVLERLRAVRNACAHHLTFDLSKSPMREHLSELRANMGRRKSLTLTRARYFERATLSLTEELQCWLLALCLLLEAILSKTRTTKRNKLALRIAAN